MRRWLAAASMCGLALAGCQRAAEEQAAAPAPPEPVLEQPARKPGLWMHKVSSEGATQSMMMCIDAETDKAVPLTGAQSVGGACKSAVVGREAGGWRIESLCNMGSAGTTVTKALVSGDFATRYVVKATTTTAGASAPQMNGTREMTMEASWHSPCPATMKPGDMSLPGGFTVNVLGE